MPPTPDPAFLPYLLDDTFRPLEDDLRELGFDLALEAADPRLALLSDLARVHAAHVEALDARTRANDAFQSVSLAFLAFYQRQRQRPTCPDCDNVGPCDPCGALIEAGNDATSLAHVALEAAFAAEAAAGRFAALLKGTEEVAP
jgi:hypothetical protein